MADETAQPNPQGAPREVTAEQAVFNWGRQTLTLAQMVVNGRNGQPESREATEAAMRAAHLKAGEIWNASLKAAGDQPKLGQVMGGYVPEVLAAARGLLDSNG